MKRDFCCHGECEQGRINCPLRPDTQAPRRFDRRTGPSVIWRLFGWLMKDRRQGDRRANRTKGNKT